MPERIQLRRTKGWRLPESAVVVSRPTKWGNPFLLGDVSSAFPSLTDAQCHGFVVNQFRDLFASPLLRERHGYPSVEEIRAELAGRDLACWCALVGEDGNPVPCHATVLLEIANSEEN